MLLYTHTSDAHTCTHTIVTLYMGLHSHVNVCPPYMLLIEKGNPGSPAWTLGLGAASLGHTSPWPRAPHFWYGPSPVLGELPVGALDLGVLP